MQDEYAGTSFDKKETQDEYGTVTGEYRVALPDGRTQVPDTHQFPNVIKNIKIIFVLQIVTYHADHENGYIADVKYEGVPSYGPAPHKGGYAPKPAPYHS